MATHRRMTVLVPIVTAGMAGVLVWTTMKLGSMSSSSLGAETEGDSIAGEVEVDLLPAPSPKLAPSFVPTAKARVEPASGRTPLEHADVTNPGAPTRSSSERTADSEAQAREKLLASMDEHFALEPVDTVWREDAVSEVGKKLPALLPKGSQLGKVECKSSMCRIETAHGGMGEFRDYIQASFMEADAQLWNGAMTAVVLADLDGRVDAVTYLAREGRPLPVPDDSNVEPR